MKILTWITVDCPDWMKNIKAKINPTNKTDNQCFNML